MDIQAEPISDHGRPLKILIIDDSPEDRRAFARMINECATHTHEFTEAENATDGLVLAQIDDWDCVFLDYNMPDVSGLDFLAEYRKATPKVVLPVVMLTGQGRESVAVDAMKHGALDYVAKAEATPERLNGIIHHALRMSAMHRQAEETARAQMRAEDELRLKQLRAAELYAISVSGGAYGQLIGAQLDAVQDAMLALLETEISAIQRKEIRLALEAAREARQGLTELGKLDLFGLLRRFNTEESESASGNGA